MEATRLLCNCIELLLIYISSVDHHRDCSGLSVKMTSKPWVDHRLFCLTTEDKRGNSENVCRLRAAWLALPPTERSTWRNGTELSLCFVFFPPDRQPFIAGIYLLMSVDTVILPGKRGECCWFSFPLRVNCPFHSPGNRRTYLSKLNRNSDSFLPK